MKKIGLTLSGGGARGFGHLGVIKALEENGIKPSVISGTSAGALIAAFYSAGYSVDTIAEISKKTDFFSLRNILFGKAGIFNMTAFENLIEEYIPGNTFEILKIPLYVKATDIIKSESVCFSSGVLSTAVMASSCVPMIYEPIKHNNTYFLDGGLLDNFPVEVIKDKCDFVIGVFVNSISAKPEHLHMKDMLDRSFHLALGSSMKEKSKKCDLYVAPDDMSRFGMFDMDKIDEIIAFSYEYASKLLKNSDLVNIIS